MLIKSCGIICLIYILTNVFYLPIASSEVIFSENFDNQPDWQPRPATGVVEPQGATATCSYGDCTGKVPTGWSYFRSTGLWWGPDYNDTIRISAEEHRGAAGKAYIQWNESNIGASGDGWGADGILAKYFNKDYQELFVQFYLKLQSGWIWSAKDNGQLKIFRVLHWDGIPEKDVFTYFSGGGSAPIYIFDLYKSLNYGWRHSHAFRCDTQETYYYCPDNPSVNNFLFDAKFTDPGQLGDGNWHKLNFRIKMNTYTNGVWNADGILQFWYDDKLMYSITNKKWKLEGSDFSIGWNVVAIGGNAYNNYSDASTKSEQSYAIDDFVVSTMPIPTIKKIE